MNKEARQKVVAKMLAKGLVTEEDIDSGIVTMDRLEMFIAGVELLSPDAGGVYTVINQLKQRRVLLASESDKKKISLHKSQIKKLEKIKSKTEKKASPVYSGQVSMTFSGAKTQKQEVIRHLNENSSLTSWEAFMEYGITRLSAIIYVLRHDEGWDIETKSITRKNRYGNPVTFAKYTVV